MVNGKINIKRKEKQGEVLVKMCFSTKNTHAEIRHFSICVISNHRCLYIKADMTYNIYNITIMFLNPEMEAPVLMIATCLFRFHSVL